MRGWRSGGLLGLALLALSGCAGLEALLCGTNCNHAGRHLRGSSSLVGFLYPAGADAVPPDALPTLPVPLRVGLAFLPERSGAPVAGLEAARRERIMQRIGEHFRGRHFIADIVQIPDYYLGEARGFEGLAGVQRLYKVDVMALVSYDQVSYQDDRGLAVGYLTIVGAYMLKGTRQDVTTLMDLAVVDPVTRSIILRAGGTDTRAHNTAYVGSEIAARRVATDSFDAAAEQLITHFDVALTQLETDIRTGRSELKLRRADGADAGGGAGALGTAAILVLTALAMHALRRRQCVALTTIHCNGRDTYAEFAAFGAVAAFACRKKMPFRWKARSSRPCRTRPSA
jgi:rhombotail lipoprotein